ncbi:MAG: tRNA preQ1(34) S-adenosylmethionine ribosyltransferase-isomerase QueA [Gemmatimonadetes bacterium]|nr:tRNA preQ1(34) S-adenosylmethionine ribosyltransferase-isomerase QueA [Gemmatimonadota bacterium]
MNLSDFDYHLPESLIAQHPSDRRDGSRLMVVDRAAGTVSHHQFTEFVEFVSAGDCLVVNETKVFPARLQGHKPDTGGRAELLLIRPDSDGRWIAMARPGRRLREGARIAFEGDDTIATIEGILEDGTRAVRFEGDVARLIERVGDIPLPPYIDREATDADVERYQTVYARTPGAVAAPTAGLHFTPELLASLDGQGVNRANVLLHVGPGTFKPVEVENVSDHKMDAEYYEVSDNAARVVSETKSRVGNVVAVGTTSVRVLESQSNEAGELSVGTGWTDIFIYPGYQFSLVDALLTNFHLPKSTLLMLISALAGRELIAQAYDEAVREEYRFYSYGDAMLIQ